MVPNIPETLSRLAVPRWFAVPLAAFLLSRAGIFAVAYLAEPLIVDNASPPPYHIRPGNVLLDVLGSRWDTGFYLSIADEGYRFGGVELPSVAFFPLLPLLINAFAPLVGDPLVAGILVTNAALLGATALLYRLAADEFGDAVASRSVWYLLIFPTSFFGSAIYSESLFLLGAVGALFFARRGSWPLAALCGFAAGFSRFVGIVVAPMLLVEWWHQRLRRSPPSRPAAAAVAAAAAPALATGAYMLYLWRVFGDPVAFARASSAWGRELSSPLAMVGDLLVRPAEGWWSAVLAGRLPLDGWIDLAAVLAFLGLGFVLLWLRRWSEGAFVTLGALIPLASGLLMSQRRYVWVLFPVFVLLGRWGEAAWVDRALTIAFILGLGLLTALFANWYWVG